MSKTFFTSDIHQGHENICKYTERLAETTVKEHDDWIVDIWNSQVNPNDIVWHIGDLSFDDYYGMSDFIKKLNGRICLIKGNHDSSKNLDRLIKDNLIQGWMHYKEIKILNNPTCLFHFPIAAWHRQGYGSYHLHGHCHSMYQGQGKSLDVGLDNAYKLYGTHRLFSEEDVQTFMKDRETFVADGHKIRE